tara:strand:+ start:165 stop:329 length:165 start_codon:yes stop_codon:yes gene_type:complete
MKKNKRNFLKSSLSFFLITFISSPVLIQKNYLKNRFKTYKKKYSKIWILDINDN